MAMIDNDSGYQSEFSAKRYKVARSCGSSMLRAAARRWLAAVEDRCFSDFDGAPSELAGATLIRTARMLVEPGRLRK